ncbi:hypothetical protein B0J11DRAFT_278117 [Dendryphion nanum]|uniref:Uncharacterized protein n=1 Tax=Dendryphion nanum TaxID=256645 RepID=A0A9P9DYH6_9PLEO|nr:hypothetical protein B0J11DRAFT_278117 [Dendryphion nanum]
MPAPLAKGLIIAASVLVAAGIAIYESPQVRQWVDQSRRKIAIALHSLGDEIQPRRSSESSQDFEDRKRRREEIIRQNRNELIKRAREEGVAVDLDELAKIGREDIEMAQRRSRGQTNASQRSFDDLVGSDGMLRKDVGKVQTATGTETETVDTNLRRRGPAGFAAGSAAASNPFDDTNAQVLFDTEEQAPSPQPFTHVETRESSATVEADAAPVVPSTASDPLIDLTPESLAENAQTASIPQSEIDESEQAAQSFYSVASGSMHDSTHPFIAPIMDLDSDVENVSAGTLTPRSERSAFTGASVVGSHADDIAVLSMQNDMDHDTRSEVFSEGGFTDAGFSEAGFSELGDRAGIMTPNSWTDVGSDDESDWGAATAAQQGHISQIQQN